MTHRRIDNHGLSGTLSAEAHHPQEAVKVVKSGDWVDYGWCTNHPIALDKALAARKDELYDVKVRGGVTMWMPEIAKADDAGDHFTWNSWHCSGIDRKIITKGMGFFSPMRYSELPRFYRENLSVDVAMIQVTPWTATATSATPWPPPTWPTCWRRPRSSSWRSTRTCPGSTA